ncbi:MLO-LIKE PROTEIN 1 [Salix purpurea]|uniref:MLO-like protein n=1 Tax=Salix purpurea TaxID=77065 RepID=A0A9Q0T3A4_SALPP|nr:MLO-LIKE PROTEIN 1 [Salix purpurea]
MATEDTSIGELELTPTWALATVCLFFISVSIVLERIFHLLPSFLRRSQRTALGDTVDKLKSELMLLGFVSLMLAVTQDHISKICIPANLADSMLPCRKEVASKLTAVQNYGNFAGSLSLENGLRGKNILWGQHRSLLAEKGSTSDGGAGSGDPCSSKKKVSLISEKGIQQLHQFIFVLAVTQIVYSVLTMALGWTKMRRWKAWEKETQTIEYQVENDPNRFRLTRQTTFGRRHMRTCTNISALLWTSCNVVSGGNCLAGGRAWLECVSLDVLCSTLGNHVYSIIVIDFTMTMVLLLGSKLEFIVAKMACRINDQNVVSRGTPLVQPNDDFFWFGHPRFVLVLIHYILFVNAFEFAFFIWVTIQFGDESCHHENTAFTVTRVVLAITVQVLCSFITLPLYALVTQMGSQYKSKALEEQVGKILKKWHAEVRERRKNQYSLRSPRATDQSITRESPIQSPTPAILPEITVSSKEPEIAQVDEKRSRPAAHPLGHDPGEIML